MPPPSSLSRGWSAATTSGLKPDRLRYTLLLDADGGILDDLMVGRPRRADRACFIVVNAADKDGRLRA